jgi:hypothetical protein
VPGTIPAAVPALAGQEQALAWARAERANLIACLDNATGTGQHARVIALTAGITGLLSHDGPWAEAIARHATALRSARHLGDRLGQPAAGRGLSPVPTDLVSKSVSAVRSGLLRSGTCACASHRAQFYIPPRLGPVSAALPAATLVSSIAFR